MTRTLQLQEIHNEASNNEPCICPFCDCNHKRKWINGAWFCDMCEENEITRTDNRRNTTTK